jgi:hypothetical protein
MREEKGEIEEEDDEEGREYYEGTEEREWKTKQTHSGGHYAVPCFCYALIPPSLLSSENWELFPRRKCAMGTTGTAHFHAVTNSEVCGAVNWFFHVSL